LASIYLSKQRYQDALKQSKIVLEHKPESYQARLLMGNIYLAQKNINAAKQEFEALIERNPKNPIGFFRLGIAQKIARNYSAARKYFEKALSLNIKSMDVFKSLILTMAAENSYDIAIKRCDKQLEILQESPLSKAVIYNLKANLYQSRKNFKEAKISLKKAIEADPNYLSSYFALARIYLHNGDEQKAINQYEAILEKNPQQIRSHMLLGTIYDMQKRFDLSEKHYRKAIEIDPDFAPAANNLAYLLASEDENIDEALRLAQMAKEKLPDDPSVMDTLGLVYLKKGLYEIAIQEFKDSIIKLPDNATVNYHLGMAYYKKEEKGLAKKYLEKTILLDSEFEGVEEVKEILSDL
jgi:tetratricopeptide (TPR) repeat protein